MISEHPISVSTTLETAAATVDALCPNSSEMNNATAHAANMPIQPSRSAISPPALGNHDMHQELPCAPPQAPTKTETENKDQSNPLRSSDSGAPRKRTRARPDQLAVLEKAFSINPSPTNHVREQLSRELGMSERSIQIWFQNRRAKVKNQSKRSSYLQNEAMRMQYYAATAATAAYQAAIYHQQHVSPDGTVVMDPDLYYYYYYYYYYYHQQQRKQPSLSETQPNVNWSIPGPVAGDFGPFAHPPPPASMQSMPLPPPPPPPQRIQKLNGSMVYTPPQMTFATPPLSSMSSPLPASVSDTARRYFGVNHSVGAKSVAHSGRVRAHSVGPYPQHYEARRSSYHERHTSSGPVAPNQTHYQNQSSTTPTIPPPGYLPATYPVAVESALNAGIQVPIANDMSSVSGVPFRVTQGQPTLMVPSTERLCTPMSLDSAFDANSPNLSSTRFSVETLQIGTWKRVTLQPEDLLCHYDVQRRVMIWGIQDGQSQFKMEFAMDTIHQISLDPIQDRLGWGRLQLRVMQPEAISFHMYDPEIGWTQCQDFTQDRQATNVGIHLLDGPTLALRAELYRLAQSDLHIHSLVWQNDIQAMESWSLTMPFGCERERGLQDTLVTLLEQKTTPIPPVTNTLNEKMITTNSNSLTVTQNS